jgi:nicotinic acid phosphoribosyltransferase
VAFGIVTNFSSDNGLPIMNQVIKLTEVNGVPVCKLSDAERDPATGLPSKFMGKDPVFAQYLARAIDWRVSH